MIDDTTQREEINTNFSSLKRSRWISLLQRASLIIIFLGLSALGIVIDRINNQQYLFEERKKIHNHTSTLRAQMEGVLNSNLQIVKGLVIFIHSHPDLTQESFSNFAAPLIGTDTQIRNIGAAPNLILSYMHPIEGNEAAIGLNYRNTPEQRQAVEQAIQATDLVVAGPVNLKQGGQAIIGRYPVFLTQNGEKRLWGILSSVIDIERYYRAAGIHSFTESHRLAIRGKDSKGANGEIFFGEAALFDTDSIVVDVTLPGGSWQLATQPLGGWPKRADNAWLVRGAIIAVLLLTIIPLALFIRAHRTTRAKDNRLRGLFELSPVGISLNQFEDGKYLETNDALQSMLGYTSKELLEKTYYDLTPSDYDEHQRALLQSLIKTSRYGPYEKEFITRHGKKIPVLMNGMLVEGEKGEKLIWSIIENISSRKQAELALAQNKRQLEQIIDNTAVGFWDWTIPTGEATFNERWAGIIGYELHELEPTSIDTWMAYAHPEDLEESSKRLQQHWEGKADHYQMEARMRHKNGEWVWVYDSGRVIEWNEDGSPQRMVGTHLDITAQKNAQRLVEASQLELNNFFDHSPNFMCIISATGYFERVNTTFTRVLGFTKEELLSHPYLHFVHSDDIKTSQHEVEKIICGEPSPSYVNRYRTKDGQYRYLQWNVTPDKNTGKLYATATDVTQARVDAENISRQKEMLVSMSQQGHIGAWEANLEDNEVYWSEMTKEIYQVDNNFTPNSEMALDFFTLEGTREKIEALMKTAIKEGTPGKVEIPIITAKGNERWVSITGHPEMKDGRCIRLFGSIQDIHDRKQAEQEIQSAHEKLEQQMLLVNAVAQAQSSYISNSDIVVAFKNLLDGLLTLTNSEYGFISEVLHTDSGTPFIKTHAIHNRSTHSEYDDFFEKQGGNPIEFFNMDSLLGSAVTSGEVVLSNTPQSDSRSAGIPEGHPKLNSYLGIPISLNNQVIGLVGVANKPEGYEMQQVKWLAPLVNTIGQMIENGRTVRERERVQKELINAKNAAELAVEAKSEFLAMMSHEIRTPLNGVLGMLNLVQRTGLENKQRYQVDVAKGSAESLLNLINDILDFSKVDAGKLDLELVDFNFSSLIEDIGHAMAARVAEKNNQLIIDITNLSESILRGDPSRLRQILVNLIGNAAKFTEHGNITVTASITPTINGVKLKVSIADTGIGIPQEKLSQLFTAFTQVDASTTRKFGGTGLGLAICKKLCVLMGGDIHVEAELNKGSVFTFDVLLQTASLSDKLCTKGLITTEECNLEDQSVYIANTNETNIKILSSIIANHNGSVRASGTDLSNFNQLDECPPFNFAFIDTRLLSGPKDVGILKRTPSFQACKFILVTSVNRTEDTENYANWGFHGYLTTPITRGATAMVLKPFLDSNSRDYPKTDVSTKSDEQAPTPDSASDLQPSHTHRLLLVEDNTVNQEVAKMMLEDLGLVIDVANNGLEALEALDNSIDTAPYSLILMDCQMPEMDGYEATKRIRQGRTSFDNTKIPIIAMTANAMKGDKEKCLAAGMDDYLSKPVEPDELEAILKLWLPLHNFNGTEKNTLPMDGPAAKKRIWAKDELLAALKGREDRMQILIKSFAARIPLVLTDLTKAEENEDIEAISFVAHSVKGSAGQIKANPLFVCATELEQAAKTANPTTTLAMCNNFRKLLSELYSLLSQELEKEIVK